MRTQRAIPLAASAVITALAVLAFWLWGLTTVPQARGAGSANAAAAAAEPSSEADLAQIQGLWERKQGDDVPGITRATKEVRGRHEVVTYYGEGDKVLRAHEVDLQVERRAGIRIFTYTNWTATAGPEKGRKSDAAVSYIYRADENTYVEVWGFLPGQEQRAPRVMMWVKKLPQTAEAASQQQALQGRWAPVGGAVLAAAAATPGQQAAAAAAPDVPGDEITFSGDDFTVRRGNQVHLSGVYRLNPEAKPRTMDLIITHSPNGLKNGQTIRAIYEVMDGGALRWCGSAATQPRPRDFTAHAGGSDVCVELRRADVK
jgi:uncharacterized protein (TIGR03067 family)